MPSAERLFEKVAPEERYVYSSRCRFLFQLRQERHVPTGRPERGSKWWDNANNYKHAVPDGTFQTASKKLEAFQGQYPIFVDASVAVMEREGIKHLASDDGDFEVVKEITLWKP